jgi:hypothetical protein
MPIQKQPTMNRLRDYATFFSRQTAAEVLSGNMDRVEQKIIRYDQHWIDSNPRTYHDYFKRAYKSLQKSYQNEYILKNELLNKWLKEHLGSPDSELYSEFRVGTAKADLAMFNGSAKAFEIKSEYDSPSRLNNQLQNYIKAFHEVYVIVPENQVSKYDAIIAKAVGLVSYSGKEFHQVRQGAVRKTLCRKTVMSLLHSKEYKLMVRDYYGELPEMTSFTQYDTCLNKIKGIDEAEFTELYLTALKSRVNRPNLSTRYFAEFNQLVLAMNWDEKQRHTYINHLKRPIN